jgi:von Willebrand factor type A domain
MAARPRTRLPLVVAAVAWLSIAAVPAQPDQVFRAAVDTVVLDVAVSRGGAPVRGLTAKHFTIVDNGTQRPAAQVFHDAVPLNLVLCFDTSSSLGAGGLERLRDAADGLLQSLRPDDRVGLVTFAEAVDVRVLPTTRHDDVRTALRLLTSQGPTAWRDALFVASQLVQPTSNARAVVLLLTDGADTSSWMRDAQIVDVMGRTGVVVHGIALENRPAEVAGTRSFAPSSAAQGSPPLALTARRSVGGVRSRAAAPVPRGSAGAPRSLPRDLCAARARGRGLAQG